MTKAKAYAELEVALHKSEAEGYRVELRFSNPESENEVPPEQGIAQVPGLPQRAVPGSE